MLNASKTLHFVVSRAALRDRLRASGFHLACCLAIAALVLLLVYFGWYPPPLDRISGLATILVIMLAADVTLGPLITLIIYDRRKKHLKLDLSAVVLIQAAALAYGLYTVYQGRPAHLVFAKDRFEVVAPAEIKAEERNAARGNPAAAVDPLRPKWVAAKAPSDLAERQTILFDALRTGRDVQHHPRLYEPYHAQAAEAVARAAPLDQLRRLNPDKGAVIDSLPAELGVAADALRFLPLKGPAGDAAVIVRADSGEILRIVALRPWP